MIIQCDKCKTKYNVNTSKIVKPKFKAKCSKCDNIFIVTKALPKVEATESLTEKQPSQTEQPVPQKANTVRVSRPPVPEVESDCKVITICNQKGGVAKTTTCLNLGASLALMGKRVLLIDFDIQSNLTLLLGYKDAKSFFEVIHSDAGDLSQYIVQTRNNLSLLPSNSKMALLSKKHMSNENFEYMLRDKLQSIKNDFDYILIDTPPSGDFYTLNALLASDIATIPAPCEYLSMNGVNHIEAMINVIKEKTDHTLDYQILITMYEPENTACKVILNKFHDQHSGKVLQTIIEKDSKIQESQIAHTPVIFYSKDSRAGLQYHKLAEEIVNKQDGAGQEKTYASAAG